MSLMKQNILTVNHSCDMSFKAYNTFYYYNKKNNCERITAALCAFITQVHSNIKVIVYSQ